MSWCKVRDGRRIFKNEKTTFTLWINVIDFGSTRIRVGKF